MLVPPRSFRSAAPAPVPRRLSRARVAFVSARAGVLFAACLDSGLLLAAPRLRRSIHPTTCAAGTEVRAGGFRRHRTRVGGPCRAPACPVSCM